MRVAITATAAAIAIGAWLLVPVPARAAPAEPPLPCPAGVCMPGLQVPELPLRPTSNPSPAPTSTPSPPPVPLPPPGPPTPPLTPEQNLQAVGRWVFAGGSWAVCQLPGQLDLPLPAQVCPAQQSLQVKLAEPTDWFAPLYRRMVQVAGLLMLPMLLLALLQALLRSDPAMALKAAFGYVPLAVILSAVAVSLTRSLLTVTDGLSAFMLRGYEGQVAGSIGSLAGVLAAGAAGGAFTGGVSAAAVIAAVVAMLAALAIFFELLIRQALIYAAVLFLPLGFAAMVWPQLRAWARRLVEVLVTAIFAKFLVVSILVMGAAAYTAAPAGGGPFDSQAPPGSTLLVGLLLVGLAALSPAALFWMLPSFEAAVLAQFRGVARQPLAAAPHLVQQAVYHRALGRTLRGRAQGGGQVMAFGPGTQVIVRAPRRALAIPPGRAARPAGVADRLHQRREVGGGRG